MSNGDWFEPRKRATVSVAPPIFQTLTASNSSQTNTRSFIEEKRLNQVPCLSFLHRFVWLH